MPFVPCPWIQLQCVCVSYYAVTYRNSFSLNQPRIWWRRRTNERTNQRTGNLDDNGCCDFPISRWQNPADSSSSHTRSYPAAPSVHILSGTVILIMCTQNCGLEGRVSVHPKNDYLDFALAHTHPVSQSAVLAKVSQRWDFWDIRTGCSHSLTVTIHSSFHRNYIK